MYAGKQAGKGRVGILDTNMAIPVVRSTG